MRKDLSEVRVPTRRTHPHLEDAEFKIEVTLTMKDGFGTTVGHIKDCNMSCKLDETPGVVEAWTAAKRTYVQFADDADKKAPAVWRKAARKAGQSLNGALLVWQNPLRLYTAVVGYDITSGTFPAGDYVLTPLAPSDRAGARKARAFLTGKAKQNTGKLAKARRVRTQRSFRTARAA